MTRVEIDQIRDELLRRLEQKPEVETIELTRNGEVIGHIQFLGKLDTRPGAPRPAGLGKGLIEVPPSFFEPLPDDLLKAFNGEGE
jgi:hypothetical protein